MIDSHCHLYLPEFSHDREMVLERGIESGVSAFLLPAIDSESTPALLRMADHYPDCCFPMAGLHPCSVKENFMQELEWVDNLLSERRFIAIGETGLDFYWDMTYADQQLLALQWQAERAIQYQLPLVLHTRNATRETIEAIEPFISQGLRGVFHCFGGNVEEAKDIIEMGFFLGIGGVLTYKNAGLDKVLPEIGLTHVILETDAPYLSPVPHRGKRNEPGYLMHVVERLADVLKISPEEVDMVTTSNTRRLFGI